MVDYQVLADRALEVGLSLAPKLLAALLTLIIGWVVIGFFSSWFSRVMKKRKVDASLRPFLSGLISVGLKVLLLITVVSMIGVQVTSFIAIIGAAGLAVGLALQGSLANFAGGVLILLFKPFKVGHYIDASGHSGTVDEIKVLYTVLKTPDKKTIIIPNGDLANSSVTNYSLEKLRRVDLEFGIGYGDDMKKTRKVLETILKKDKRVLKDPEYQIIVGGLGASSVDFKVRAWTKAEDYWTFYFDMQETVKNEFDKNGISFTFPQRDIHLYKEK